MKLTGKCKSDFEKWLLKPSNNTKHIVDFLYSTLDHNEEITNYADYMSTIPNSMQYGVLVDFFDSKEIYIDITYNGVYWGFAADVGDEVLPHRNTRPEARTNAIEKANEIYNTKNG